MVKLTGPGLALGAGGSLASTVTFSNWKGKSYLKMHRAPQQPRSIRQVSMRAMMAFLSDRWSHFSLADQATWDELAAINKISSFNAFTGENLARWRNHLAPSKTFPPAQTGSLPTVFDLVAAGAVRHVVINHKLLFGPNQTWGALLFHSTIGSPTSDFQNLVQVQLFDAVDDYYWTHTPLAAGTHYYRLVPFTTTGNVNWGTFRLDSAVVT